jgi:hypothetical protein
MNRLAIEIIIAVFIIAAIAIGVGHISYQFVERMK